LENRLAQGPETEQTDSALPVNQRGGVYRGWPIAAVTFVALGAVLGTSQFAFGVFIIPLEEEFGWTRTQINVSLSLGVLTGVVGPIAGRSMDRFGACWVMTVGLGIIATGFFLRARMNDLWQLYLFTAMIFAGTTGVTNLPAERLVTLWIAKTRSRMMGFVTAGTNFGAMISIPLITALIAVAGWRSSFAYIGGAMVLPSLSFTIERRMCRRNWGTAGLPPAPQSIPLVRRWRAIRPDRRRAFTSSG
jgi:MFS family permease